MASQCWWVDHGDRRQTSGTRVNYTTEIGTRSPPQPLQPISNCSSVGAPNAALIACQGEKINKNQTKYFSFSLAMGSKARLRERQLPEGDGSIQVSVCPAWWSFLMWSVMADGRTGVALLKEWGKKKTDKSQFPTTMVQYFPLFN